ncbi:hypothetical protein ACET3Z_029881 [Daucus carota]
MKNLLLSPTTLPLPKMSSSSSSKTLTDFFERSSKRLKTTTTLSSPSDSLTLPDDSDLSPDQKSRIEFNKLLAKSKRNLKLCSQRVSKASTGDGVMRLNLKLEELLVEETWLEALPSEFEKPYAKKLCEFVENEICGSGFPIYPPPHLIFNALNTTPFDRVKAVIIGQDPYHGPGQAMGLSFSVPEGIKVPSSLGNIYKELKQDLQCSIPSHGNLERWALQGVLLLNSVLTVRQHQANSHAKKGWEQYTDAVIETISKKKRGVVFLLWGNYAQVKSRLIDGTKHHILKAAHPSGLSANRGFFGCRHFSRTNQLLEEMGMSPIDWQL